MIEQIQICLPNSSVVVAATTAHSIVENSIGIVSMGYGLSCSHRLRHSLLLIQHCLPMWRSWRFREIHVSEGCTNPVLSPSVNRLQMLGRHEAAHADNLVCHVPASLLSIAEPTVTLWDTRDVARLVHCVSIDSALATN